MKPTGDWVVDHSWIFLHFCNFGLCYHEVRRHLLQPSFKIDRDRPECTAGRGRGWMGERENKIWWDQKESFPHGTLTHFRGSESQPSTPPFMHPPDNDDIRDGKKELPKKTEVIRERQQLKQRERLRGVTSDCWFVLCHSHAHAAQKNSLMLWTSINEMSEALTALWNKTNIKVIYFGVIYPFTSCMVHSLNQNETIKIKFKTELTTSSSPLDIKQIISFNPKKQKPPSVKQD